MANNNKCLLLVALGALLCAIQLAQAADRHGQEALYNGQVGSKVRDQFGAFDVFEHGLHRLAPERKPVCPNAKSKKDCQLCCNQNRMAYSFQRGTGMSLLKGTCTCHGRVSV